MKMYIPQGHHFALKDAGPYQDFVIDETETFFFFTGYLIQLLAPLTCTFQVNSTNPEFPTSVRCLTLQMCMPFGSPLITERRKQRKYSSLTWIQKLPNLHDELLRLAEGK